MGPGDDASLFNKKWSGCYKKSQEADSFIEKTKMSIAANLDFEKDLIT